MLRRRVENGWNKQRGGEIDSRGRKSKKKMEEAR
jgi:hypothetical protein